MSGVRKNAVGWATVMVLSVAGGVALGQAKKPRDPVVIRVEVEDVESRLWRDYPTPALADPKRRAELQEKAAPLIRKRLALVKELFAADPKSDEAPHWVTKYISSLAWLTYYGDEDAKKTLDTMAASDNRALALYGRVGKFMAQWYANITNEAELEKLLEQAKGLVTRAPKDEVVGNFFVSICNEAYKYPEPLRDKLETMVVEELSSAPVATWKLVPRVGRLYSFSGKLVDKKAFESTSLKGKVVVVHFWVTTDVRYRDQLAKLSEIYKGLKGQDVEFVGVSLDENRRLPEGYLQGHPELAWPQLYDEKAKGAHPLVAALGYLPIALPTSPPILSMTILDKEGRFREGKVPLERLAAEIKKASNPIKVATSTQPAAHTQASTTTKKGS